MTDLSHLSPSEYEKISSVLKRDRELRSVEEARIRQLKQELGFLRKRAALKPGFDPLRNCARCLAELGRILNRGALCPRCSKKVCKDCRQFGDENHEWLCLYCFKHMQLKAISGEWMQEFSKLSVQQCAKDPPGDHLRKVLHESQRKSFHVMDETDHTKSPVPPEDSPPQKPPRSYQYEQNSDVQHHSEKETVNNVLADFCEKPTEAQFNPPETIPKTLPRVSPWNGIDPEPTIPLRVDKSRPFGTIQQFDYPVPSNFRERQSSDEGHCTIGCRSRSTSSEVVDENDLSSVPLPRKKLSPLKKQKAIPEKNPVENQQSSVETTDSGVCSPGLKVDNFAETTAPPSPLAVSTHLSTDQETVDFPSNRPRLFAQHLVSRSSSESESESDEEQQPQQQQRTPNKKSDILFRKVTLKKRKASPCVKPLEKKHSAAMIPKPFSGLTKSSFKNNNSSSVSYCKTNFKRELTLSSNNISYNCKANLNSMGSGLGVKKRSMLPISYSKTYADACAGRSPAINTEALSNGVKNVHRKEVTESRIPSLQERGANKKLPKTENAIQATKLPCLKSNTLKKNSGCQISSVKPEQSHSSTSVTPKAVQYLCEQKTAARPCFVRRASLPNRRNPSYDWLQTCAWKCHSLEDWLWYIEEQPYKSQKFSHVNYPDEYKLVYVSSSTSVDSDENDSDLDSCKKFKELRRCARKSKFRTRVHLKVQSRIKVNDGASYIEDSDWELESGDSDDPNAIPLKHFKELNSHCKIRKKCQNSLSDVKISCVQKVHSLPRVEKLSAATSVSNNVLKQTRKSNAKQGNLYPNKSNLLMNCSYFPLLHCHSKIKTMSSRTELPTITTLEIENQAYNTTKTNAAVCYSNSSCYSFPYRNYDSYSNLSFRVMPTCELDIKRNTFMLFAVEDLIHRFLCSKTLPLSSDLSLSSYVNQFSSLTRSFTNYFISSHSKRFQHKFPEFNELLENCSKLILQIGNNISIRCFANDFRKYDVNLVDKNCDSLLIPPRNQVLEFSLSAFTPRLKLSLQCAGTTLFIYVDIGANETLRSKYSLSQGLISSLNYYFELLSDFFRQDRCSVISCSGTYEFHFPFLPCGEFDSLDWSRCFGIKEELPLRLNEAANAFYFPPYLTKRGNDKSAVTGWKGEGQCCIERVIDLNLGALECDREVLDLADLTLYLGWTAGARASSSAKHGAPASVVNTFFYHVPPVALKPEAGCLLRPTRSFLRLLLKLQPHASGEARMNALKTDDTALTRLVRLDNENNFCFWDSRKRIDAMQSEKEDSSISEASVDCEFISHSNNASRLTKQNMRFAIVSEMSSTQFAVENVDVNKLNSDSQLAARHAGHGVSSFSNIDLTVRKSDVTDSDSEILPYIRRIFSSEFGENSPGGNLNIVSDPFELCKNVDVNERVDCQCNKPCDVPSSPSVVDATLDARGLADDGEIFSSGDELDKLESDTDSQDTVIEGEAYKRIRSVAIKEKILHANEELFGATLKESYFENANATKFSDDLARRRNLNYSSNSKNNEDSINESTTAYFIEDNESDNLSLESEDSTSACKYFSIEKQLKSFMKGNQSAFQPVVPKKRITESELSDCTNEFIQLSSYQTNFSENICSSESSDNGSDGEELALSDISTSSDEATYIAPSASIHCYSNAVSHRLHTIVEESCEESEKSSRGATPTSRASSEFEYYDKSRLLSSKAPRKYFRKSVSDNANLGCNELKNGKGSAVYAVLATSRLEKYFKSGLLEGQHVSYPEDELTDESGGISSDDESAVSNQKDKSKSHVSKFSNSKKLNAPSGEKPTSGVLRKSAELEQGKLSLNSKKVGANSSSPTSSGSSELLHTETKHGGSDFVSDDEAKYIMSHLMQHISNNDAKTVESNSEIKDMSPMLKILESEIARLMLTVSPASLSAGEPSSSCSSTIGSNNSDYGSDTLESGEESTDDELNNEIVPENRAILELSPSVEDVDPPTVSEPTAVNSNDILENNKPSDSSVTEETLYICKQLMASLKKIADSSDVVVAPDELSPITDDNSAKQYITDQIVSLMQTVSASHNNSPLLRTLNPSHSSLLQLDSDVSHDLSDSDSPPPNYDKREHLKSKTPSESGSETTISASISIPSYDDSDRTPTESEISHEMDELYALLESNGTAQELISSKFPYDADAYSLDKSCPRSRESPTSEEDTHYTYNFYDNNESSLEKQSSLLCGAASKLESLLPISIEERIARYKDAFLSRNTDSSEKDFKASETRINVILPQPASSEKNSGDLSMCKNINLSSPLVADLNPCEKHLLREGSNNIMSSYSDVCKHDDSYNITSVKIISHNTYPLSSAIHKILSSNIDSQYLEHKLDYKIVNILDDTSDNPPLEENRDEDPSLLKNDDSCEGNESTIVTSLPKVMNPKEKASSENDLLVANYRAKTKGNKVFGTKSVGNISELENMSNKSTFRDTGYYSFKSSEESFLSFDDSTASQTSTASLTQYRSLTSTETIPEEEESCTKPVTKMSLSSSNIPDAVCGTSPSKSSTLPLSLRSKLSATPGGSHRTRSSFFSTSGVLRKLTLLRDESGNSLRSSPHGRLRMRNRSLSGGSEDAKQRKASLPQISVSECTEGQVGRLSAASSEKESSGVHEDEIDQAFAYHCRSQMSLSSFGGRCESVTSVYSAAGGGRYGTVTVTGEVLFGLSYNYKASSLEVIVKECRNLAAVDIKRNRSDPYVKVYLLPDRTKSGKRKTKVKKHTLSPVFDERLKFSIMPSEMEIRTLWLSVWHSDRFGRNDFLGEVMLPLGNDSFENNGLKWYPLQERMETLDTPVSYKGDLILALKYVPPDVTSRKFSKKPGVPVKGALEVLVKEARNLMATRSNGTSDPFCKSYLLPDKTKSGKQKTPVFKKSCNPKWNHTFLYDDVSLDDLRERCLELTIWDYDKITSNDFLGGVRLCLGTGKYQGRDVDWMDSVGEERSLWYTMIERPNTWVEGSLLLRPNMQNRKSA